MMNSNLYQKFSEFDRDPISIGLVRGPLKEHPEEIETSAQLMPKAEYHTLKKQIQDICEINPETKVMKLRNSKGVLIPLSFIFDSKDEFFYIDINNISYVSSSSASLLQDAYVDAVRHKVKTMESRIAQAELLLPQLEWRRQSYMEETVNSLINRVAFLNRRFDELLPQHMAKIPESTS